MLSARLEPCLALSETWDPRAFHKWQGISIFSDLPMTKDGPGGLLMRGQFFSLSDTIYSSLLSINPSGSYLLLYQSGFRLRCAFLVFFCFFFCCLFLQLLPFTQDLFTNTKREQSTSAPTPPFHMNEAAMIQIASFFRLLYLVTYSESILL